MDKTTQTPPVRQADYVPPLPDRNITTAFWMSLCLGIIGLDHFYLRSPKTGILKALTFGGLGFWWLWDVFQLAFEKKQVSLYGLTAPFGLANSIGQGQITTGPVHVGQRTDYFYWCLSAIMDIFGLTALIEGRPAAFLRRLIDGVLMITFSSMGTLFGFLMAAIFAFFTIVPAFFTLRGIMDPVLLATKGVAIPSNLVKLLNFFESWTDIIGPNATAVVREDFGLASVNSATANKSFAYEHEDVLAAEADNANATSGDKKKEIVSWPISMMLGNVFGGLVMWIVSFFTWIPTVKMGLFAADTYFAGVRMSRGETPDMPDILGMLPPGVSQMAEKAKETLGEVGGVETVKALAEGKMDNLAGKLEAIAGGKVANLTNKLEESVESKVTGLEESIGRKIADVAKTLDGTAGLAQKLEGLKDIAAATTPTQKGGSRNQESLTTESLVLGSTVLALIIGGAIKLSVDTLVR